MSAFKTLALTGLAISFSYAAYASPTIAVPDLGYKEEVRTFFYYESASAKSKVSDTEHFSASGHDRENAALAVSDHPGAGYVAGRSDAELSASGAHHHNSEDEGHYLKTYHDKVKIQYGELRGMSARIREALLKSGFKVIHTAPKTAKAGEGDQFFNINKRIKAGEFGKADYVLYGVIAAIDYQNNPEPLAGTNTQMNIHELTMTVDYSLIDTRTLTDAASFTVSASGNDNKIGSPLSNPSAAKIVDMLGENLSDEVADKLHDQGIIKDAAATGEEQPMPASGGNSEAVALKVYKPD